MQLSHPSISMSLNDISASHDGGRYTDQTRYNVCDADDEHHQSYGGRDSGTIFDALHRDCIFGGGAWKRGGTAVTDQGARMLGASR